MSHNNTASKDTLPKVTPFNPNRARFSLEKEDLLQLANAHLALLTSPRSGVPRSDMSIVAGPMQANLFASPAERVSLEAKDNPHEPVKYITSTCRTEVVFRFLHT